MSRPAVVSCHVERVLDDAVWRAFSRLARRRPGGFAIASHVRPPDLEAGEDVEEWGRRVRELAALGPLGHHTHFGGPTQARPVAAGAAERVRREAELFRAAGVAPRYFCGGGWYLDAEVADAVAALGYVDCSATSFRLAYLPDGAAHVRVPAPTRLRLADGRSLLELPATRSIGMLARGLLRRDLDEEVVHVHFHDWDAVDARARLALTAGLRLLRLVRTPLSLDELAAREPGREALFAEVLAAGAG